jgi:signal transduction histidine kinase
MIWVETEQMSENQIATRIHNNGIGIAESVLPHTFDLFFTISP